MSEDRRDSVGDRAEVRSSKGWAKSARRWWILCGLVMVSTSIVLAGFFLSHDAGFPWKEKKIVWETATPESQGLDSAMLVALRDNLAKRQTHALVIVRNNQIVYEWYAPGHGRFTQEPTSGLAGAIVGTLALLVALNDGRLSLEDPAWKYIPAWENDPLKSQITIRHLATHASGLEPPMAVGKTQQQLEGWKKAFWERAQNPFSIALNQAPVVFRPGTQRLYSATGATALAYAVTASLRNAPQSDIRTLLKERIMDPLGVPETDWGISYGREFHLDGLNLYLINGGGKYTPRAVARIGQLMLNKGRWLDRQLIDSALIITAVSDAGLPMRSYSSAAPQPAWGLGWITNSNEVWSSVPRDAFGAAGAGHEVLLVVPSLNLVVVRNGEFLGGASNHEVFGEALERHLLNPLMSSFNKLASST